MWLFTRYGFFSVAQSQGNKDQLMIRARARHHLEALQKRFPLIKGLPIIELQGRDYRWRLLVHRINWKEILSDMAMEQTWSNIKDECFRNLDDGIYAQAMHAVWQLMYASGREWDGVPEEGD